MKTTLPLDPQTQALKDSLPTCSIGDIAVKISNRWKPVYFGARPYLDAMASLNSINDDYGLDSGKSIVMYFLCNAQTFRGPAAKVIKDELKRRM